MALYSAPFKTALAECVGVTRVREAAGAGYIAGRGHVMVDGIDNLLVVQVWTFEVKGSARSWESPSGEHPAGGPPRVTRALHDGSVSPCPSN